MEIVVVGRIVLDLLEGGKLNVVSIVFEILRRMGMGFRVLLKMDKICLWSFFFG